MASLLCGCDTPFPVCSCFEGVSGLALAERSFVLSSLAGFPGPVAPADAARVVAEYGMVPHPAFPPWLGLPRILPRLASEDPPADCGCSGRA